jgi:hypothetical protein
MHDKRFLTIFPFEPVLLQGGRGHPFFLAKTCGWKSSWPIFKAARYKANNHNANYDKVVTIIPLGVIGNKLKNIIRIMRFLMSRAGSSM